MTTFLAFLAGLMVGSLVACWSPPFATLLSTQQTRAALSTWVNGGPND